MRVVPGVLSVGVQDFLHGIEPTLPGEVRGKSDGVHLFSIDGIHMAYDGASGVVHRLSLAGRDVLAWALEHPFQNGDEPPAALLSDLRNARHSLDDIRESWADLLYLSGKTVFTKDSVIEEAKSEDSGTALNAGVKAMCLDVAHDCNLCCSYCFAGSGRFGGSPHLMTVDAGRASVDFLITSSKERRFLDVDFFGGEPLLSFEVVKDVVKYARQKGRERGKEFRFTLTTNCTLLDESKLSFLNDQKVSLILSIDGRPEVHDAHRRFIGGKPSHRIALERARRAADSRHGQDYYLRGTYTRANLDFDADIRYLYDEGFRKISIEPAVGDPDDGVSIRESDIPELRESYGRVVAFWLERAQEGDPFEFYHFNLGLTGGLCRERRITGCGAGYEYVAVTPTGEIYPCHQLVGKAEYLIGDVRSGIVETGLARDFHAARVPDKPACVACWARYLCGGGCHARAIAAGNPLTSPDPLSCRIMTTRLEYALYAQISRALRQENL